VLPRGRSKGRKAKKKIVSLGLRMLIRTPEVMTLRADRGTASSSTVSAPLSLHVAKAI
jgi:hypothetical protein